MKKYNVISLFAGCGGLDLGFTGGFNFLGKKYPTNKFQIIWANDYDKDACLTYKYNLKHNIICGDIRDILSNPNDYNLPETIDIVLGGFPCQDFSHAGKRQGFDAERGTLYKSMLQVIKRTQPKLFVAENVKGLMTMDGGNALKKIISDFSSLGYNVTYKLYSTANFGVPQFRERVLIVGTLKGVLPSFDHMESVRDSSSWINLGKAIGDLEDIEEGGFSNHYWSKAKKNNGQGNSLVNEKKPGPTMRAEHHGNIEFHWNGKRRLSAREAARIQSFPDNFIFLPSTSKAYKQIGNAVPPVFGWHAGNAIEKFLDKHLTIKHDFHKKYASDRTGVLIAA